MFGDSFDTGVEFGDLVYEYSGAYTEQFLTLGTLAHAGATLHCNAVFFGGGFAVGRPATTPLLRPLPDRCTTLSDLDESSIECGADEREFGSQFGHGGRPLSTFDSTSATRDGTYWTQPLHD